MVVMAVYDEFTINVGKPIRCTHFTDINSTTTHAIGTFAVARRNGRTYRIFNDEPVRVSIRSAIAVSQPGPVVGGFTIDNPGCVGLRNHSPKEMISFPSNAELL